MLLLKSDVISNTVLFQSFQQQFYFCVSMGLYVHRDADMMLVQPFYWSLMYGSFCDPPTVCGLLRIIIHGLKFSGSMCTSACKNPWLWFWWRPRDDQSNGNGLNQYNQPCLCLPFKKNDNKITIEKTLYFLFFDLQENDMINTVKDSGRIEKQFNGYFDEIIVNDNFEESYVQLRRSLNEMTTKQQWVPVNWIY